ncbi:MAG: GntR family transcriptional regulator [Clostridia bacterium]
MPNKTSIYKADDIYKDIKNAIINFEYEPGRQISENEIASKCGISRTPVKSVFTRLENEGFLNVLPQRGTYVSYLDSKNINNFIYMRLVLEVDILEKFINQLTELDILTLENYINEQKIKSSAPNFVATSFLKEDTKFHGYIYEKVGFLGIWEEIQKLQVNYTRFRILDLTQSCKFSTLIDEHTKLFEAIKEKDLAKCKVLLKAHLQGNYQQTIKSDLKKYFI